MQQESLSRVDALVRQKTAEVERTKEAVTAEKLGELLSQEIYQVLLRTCASEFASSGKEVLDGFKVHMDGISGIEQKKDIIAFEIQTVDRVERDPDGIIEHVTSFFGKKFYTLQRGTRTETHEIELGVNGQQAISLAHDQLDKLFREEVPGLMKKIGDQYLLRISKLLEAASEQIKQTRQEMEMLKC